MEVVFVFLCEFFCEVLSSLYFPLLSRSHTCTLPKSPSRHGIMPLFHCCCRNYAECWAENSSGSGFSPVATKRDSELSAARTHLSRYSTLSLVTLASSDVCIWIAMSVSGPRTPANDSVQIRIPFLDSLTLWMTASRIDCAVLCCMQAK